MKRNKMQSSVISELKVVIWYNEVKYLICEYLNNEINCIYIRMRNGDMINLLTGAKVKEYICLYMCVCDYGELMGKDYWK